VSRDRLGVTHPKGDDFERYPRLKQAHCAGMAKSVARNPASLERRTPLGGFSDRQSEAEADSVAAERLAVPIGEDQLLGSQMVAFAPAAEPSLHPWPQRHGPVPAPLAAEMNRMVAQVLGSQLQGFRNAGSCTVKDSEEQPIPPAGLGCRIGRLKHRVYLLTGHESEDGLDRLLLGNREDPMSTADEIDAVALAQHESNKGPNRCQPHVARARAIAPRCLQVLEESEHGGRTEGVERQPVRRAMQAMRKKGQEEAEGVPVAVSGVGAQVALRHQVVGEETLHEVR